MSGVGAAAPLGWLAQGVAAGIKVDGRLDVAAFVSETPAAAAAVFTTNLVRAAPVVVSEEHLRGAGFRAVVVSSGNANAATGEHGLAVARAMCAAAARALGCEPTEVLVAQTGLIGIPLDPAVAERGAAAAASAAAHDGGAAAAEAMLTTDTVVKVAVDRVDRDGHVYTVGGTAKGAAMLAPSMATMLAVVTTDAAATAGVLDTALHAAMDASFHAIVVDGSRSTNDTVFLLANGASGTETIDSTAHPGYPALADAVSSACRSLALQMVRDAEGATKRMRVTVSGARDDADARAGAHAVVSSLLVKCSLAGADPYWGRVLSELGASGMTFDPDDTSIAYGGIVVCSGGTAADHDAAAVAGHMAGAEIVIDAIVGDGPGAATMWGCDLTHAYVDENMGTS